MDRLVDYLSDLEIEYYVFVAPDDRYNVFTGIEDNKLLCAKYDGDADLLYENINHDGSIDVNII